MNTKRCIRCRKPKPLSDYDTFKDGRVKSGCKVCAAADNATRKVDTNYAGNPTGKYCEYCCERHPHSHFPLRKDGRRELICLNCVQKVIQARIEWGQIALQPIKGERYHRSVSKPYSEVIKSRRRAHRRVECDFGNGVSMRGLA